MGLILLCFNEIENVRNNKQLLRSVARRVVAQHLRHGPDGVLFMPVMIAAPIGHMLFVSFLLRSTKYYVKGESEMYVFLVNSF